MGAGRRGQRLVGVGRRPPPRAHRRRARRLRPLLRRRRRHRSIRPRRTPRRSHRSTRPSTSRSRPFADAPQPSAARPRTDRSAHLPVPSVGGVPSAFSPASAAATSSSTRSGLDPLAIGAAVLGVLARRDLPAAVGHLRRRSPTTRSSSRATGAARVGDFGTRTDIGIVLMQVLYGAIVLGPVAAVLFVARQPAARVVGILAGAAGLLVVVGRLLLDVPADPGFGLGFWLSLLVAHRTGRALARSRETHRRRAPGARPRRILVTTARRRRSPHRRPRGGGPRARACRRRSS